MLASFVKARREELGLSQTALGKKVPVSQAFVNKIEQGGPVPLDKLDQWAKALRLDDKGTAEFQRLAAARQSDTLGKRLAYLEANMAGALERERRTAWLAKALIEHLPPAAREAAVRFWDDDLYGDPVWADEQVVADHVKKLLSKRGGRP